MRGDTYYMDNADGDNTLSFASPLAQDDRPTAWLDGKLTYRYDVTTLILEDTEGPGRATYSVWDRNADSGQWDLTDNEPGIMELLTTEEMYREPCADCLTELPPIVLEDHSDDCRREDEDLLAMSEGYFCCDADRDATEEAHRVHKTNNDVACSLYPDFLLLDGGDVLCRYHTAEAFSARWLWVGNDYDECNRNALLRQYFGARAHGIDTMPDTSVLRDLASLERSRRILDNAEHERARRDNVIARLRGNVSQAIVGKWSGVSQQRVGQINAEADERGRELRQRLEAEARS